MPNYDFKCEECGCKFSKLVAYKERDQVKCKSCDSGNTKQIFTSIMIKGGSSSKGSSGSSDGCGTCSGGSCC